MPTVDVNGARLWYDEAGSGETVLLLHGGLGDSGLWEPVVPFLAERFRTIRTDLRFFGRSTGPAVPDPPGFREIGPLVVDAAQDARHVELDSDHYLTLREPELLSRVLLGFLTAAAPEE